MKSATVLIIPIETLVREFDAKLLLACVAAERGLRVILGSRRELHLRATSLPRGVYLAKDVRPGSKKMIHIMRELGHEVVALDEESLVRFPAEQYFAKRASPAVLQRLSALFCWGQDDAKLFRDYLGAGAVPVHATGNPRIDLLRPELRGHLSERAEGLRKEFGDFVLVNTNFSISNHYLPDLSAAPPSDPFLAGLTAHKAALFESFQSAIRRLSEAFPETRIVVRPHPSENHAPWLALAEPLTNVHVVYEGTAAPWLLASRAMIHNGCTTAIEAFVLGTPAIAYRPVRSDTYEYDLPDSLSRAADDFAQLRETLRSILGSNRPLEPGNERRERLARHVSSLEGPLAADRIVDVIAQLGSQRGPTRAPPVASRLRGWVGANYRAGKIRLVRSRRSDTKSNADYQRHKYGGVSVDDLRVRAALFGRLLGRFDTVRVEPLRDQVFEISATATAR